MYHLQCKLNLIILICCLKVIYYHIKLITKKKLREQKKMIDIVQQKNQFNYITVPPLCIQLLLMKLCMYDIFFITFYFKNK